MQIIHEQATDGIQRCDIDISKDEWLEILESPDTGRGFLETLLRFYYMPGHKGSCKQTSREMGGSAAALNLYVTKFGSYVKKLLNRFEVIGTDGKPTRWLVPMGQGRRLEREEEGTFEWQLRAELVSAIEEYLYRYLVRQYKALRRKLPISSDKSDELYKWETIRDCKGKDAAFIVRRLCKDNLIDVQHDASVIKYMLKEKPAEYHAILQALTEGSAPLNDRLRNFKQAMTMALPEMLNGKKIMSRANDERMAAAILACHSPGEHTFYINKAYVKLCQYLGISDKSAGKCYEHFLQLMKPLQRLVETDAELHAIVADSLQGHEPNSLLLAQDVLWKMLVMEPRRLDFIYPIVWRPRYWLVGFNFNDNESQLDRFVAEGIWEGRFEADKKQISTAKRIKTGDILILKSTFVRQKKIPCLKVSGIAIVTGAREEVVNDNGLVSVARNVSFINLDKKEFAGSHYGKYLSTVQECTTKETELTDYVNSILNMEQQKKYDRYTELLRANYNLILTGAPGTGKTFRAKEIAKEMGAEWELVQFHPSYDYTDFVEGLRPKKDENGNVGFERRDGVFKAFCKRALKNLEDSRQGGKEPSPFVFIIDEINRGEISKIFGELFYSIDSGYRGVDGRVNTQYQNMIEEGDAFKDGFYVPENVYIIGTMNDIDRSVESMDFAMRRRFVWEEVTAEESYEAMIAHDTDFFSLREEIHRRMSHLNEAILDEKLGLGEAYQIGAAYFRKALQYAEKNPDAAFEMLWNNHLKGLLAEYLRGNPNARQQLEKLHDAYNNTRVEDDHNDEGQQPLDADS